jgi:hypothetical protein
VVCAAYVAAVDEFLVPVIDTAPQPVELKAHVIEQVVRHDGVVLLIIRV